MLEAEPTAPHSLTVTVNAIVDHDDGARLTGQSTIGDVAVVVPSKPDLSRARRWAASVRRVDRVEVRLDHGSVCCRARGQSSRLPFTQSVPLAIGLGLGLLGVPLIVTGVEQ